METRYKNSRALEEDPASPIDTINPKRRKVRAHQDRVQLLQKELKNVLKESKDYLLQNNIKEEKKKWIHRRVEPLQQQETEYNNHLYQRIEQIKTRKAEFNARIRSVEEKLSVYSVNKTKVDVLDRKK
ncbi:hypothetical protein AB4K20DRAFT_1987626 [Rhizopus microsporus]|uniref:Uncharacterized protein n=1 Tax=Rhizopus microsporus TaxID=58291 RepID=A0A1X0RQL1_RHIZD|nr:hypothetical protein BCV71DRAFT_238510 [Rhizopus microsporus]